jgi:dephospho-CoA kinase
MERDNVSRDQAEELLNVQMPDQEKIERAGFVLPNDGSKEQLIKSVDRLYQKFLKITQKGPKVLDS